jgi:hypothetical protein
MSDEYVDPSGNTDQFKAFVRSDQPEPARSKAMLYVGLAVAVVVLALLAFLVLS